jgi:regulator of sigma E protease
MILSDSIVSQILKLKVKGVFSQIRYPNVVDSVIKGMPGDIAGLLKGDSIVAVNNKSTEFFGDFAKEIINFSNDTVDISLYRKEEFMTIPVIVNNQSKIGYIQKSGLNYFDYKHKKYGFFESIPAGVTEGVETLGTYVKSLSLIFNKEGAKQIGGFGTIGKLFPTSWNWYVFWQMTALLSIILAFMNILPIPALDGGHVMFLIYEMITGKPPSDKFLTGAQVVGMTLLFTLLIYANGMDIYRWISG